MKVHSQIFGKELDGQFVDELDLFFRKNLNDYGFNGF